MFTFKPLVLLAALAHFATAAVLETRNDTPNFYLVASNSTSSANLLVSMRKKKSLS
jgi:hypothetical protein